MKYYRYEWLQSRPDHMDWGNVVFYWEVGAEDYFPRRHLEVYANGNAIAYDWDHSHDDYGRMADHPVIDEDNVDDADLDEISADDFEAVWNSARPLNRNPASE